MTRKDFEYLYNTHVNAVARFLSYYTKRTDQLEDWVQIVFLKLWKYRESIDMESDYLKTYLLKTARNVALTELEKEKQSILDFKPEIHGIASDEEIVDNFEPEGMSVRDARTGEQNREGFMEKYRQALKKVPPKAHAVYTLSRKDGLSYKEIAKTLQISPRTVEVHISKTLRILRKELKEFSGGREQT